MARALGAPVVSRASTWAAKAESLDGADIVRAHVVVGEVASVARPQTDDGRRCVRREDVSSVDDLGEVVADHLRPCLSTIALAYHEMEGRAVERCWSRCLLRRRQS